MADRREAILARLAVICGALPGFETVARNRVHFDAAELPALAIMEGDEEATGGDSRGRGPQLVTMTPQIVVMASDAADDLGATVNALRAALVTALPADATLQDLTGPNGSISYGGMETDLGFGRKMEGMAGISFAFTYPLILSEL